MVTDEEWARVPGLPVDAVNIVLAVPRGRGRFGMKVVGILLIAALTALPVASAQLLERSFARTLRLACAIGAASATVGMLAGRLLRTFAPGGAIVIVAAVVFTVVAVTKRTAPRSLVMGGRSPERRAPHEGGRATRRHRAAVHVGAQAPRGRAGPGRELPLPLPAILTRHRALKQSSVYRNLGGAGAAGLPGEITDEGFGRYELTEDLTGHHHHLGLLELRCGGGRDFEPGFEETLEAQLADLADRTGFSAVSHRLDLIGLCRSCAAAASA